MGPKKESVKISGKNPKGTIFHGLKGEIKKKTRGRRTSNRVGETVFIDDK